jgi:hypothetical protein
VRSIACWPARVQDGRKTVLKITPIASMDAVVILRTGSDTGVLFDGGCSF